MRFSAQAEDQHQSVRREPLQARRYSQCRTAPASDIHCFTIFGFYAQATMIGALSQVDTLALPRLIGIDS